MRGYISALLSPTAVHVELFFVLGIGLVLGFMLVPLPSQILDLLLAASIGLAFLILFAALLSVKTLTLSSFPTLLLFATLLRLGLNVSTTRMILTEARAGDVVKAFGQFVAQGDLAVGVSIYILITLIQLLVIGRGAERVSEVAARFTLDAMPGKQMSIDASSRSGSISEEEAEFRRAELAREAQFYGAMDGAMKFVKGDATLGLIVTFLNLCIGMAIGVLRFDMSLSDSMQSFALLTIGDGLVSQLPALLIALAAGVVTTRVISSVDPKSLGSTLGYELFQDPRAIGLVTIFLFLLCGVPGIPKFPFACVGLIFLITAARFGRHNFIANLRSREHRLDDLDSRKKMVEVQKSESDELLPTVPVVSIDIDSQLSSTLGFGIGQDEHTELMSQFIPEVRDAIFAETGVNLPGVRVRSFVQGLAPNTVVYKIKDIPVSVESIELSLALSLASPEELLRLGVESKPVTNPVSGAQAAYVDLALKPELSAAGVSVWEPAGVVALHLLRISRENIFEFIGLQETADLVDRLKQVSPELVEAFVPRSISYAQLRDVLKQLLRENVSIRDLKTILEAIGDVAHQATDTISLVERARMGLSRQIAHHLAGGSGRIAAATIDPELEDHIRGAIVETPQGAHLALDPELRSAFQKATAHILLPMRQIGVQPTLMTQPDVRFFVRSLLENEHTLNVVSYLELPADVIIHPVGCVRLGATHETAAKAVS